MSLRDYNFKIFYSGNDDRLHEFYIPALSVSTHYDRSAGYFSSTALAIAAAGVARLIQKGGTMRLLVGAELLDDDVAAIERGHQLESVVAERLLAHFQEPVDNPQRWRLEALAWMIATETLHIKVVLPKNEYGRPLSGSSAPYFHSKHGIFTDARGDKVAFSGSANESKRGWQDNFEDLTVFNSWEHSPIHLYVVETRFEQVWTGQEPGWLAIDIPEAVRQHLLHYRPAHAPTHDPLEQPPSIAETALPFYLQQPFNQLRVQYLIDAPNLWNGQWVGAATSAVTPWPHQLRVAEAVIRLYPERFLLCDEVGLGKTIEAGLILRQLWLSGMARRILILAPKSVCRQWQEELYEKFALAIPIFDGHVLIDLHQQETIPHTDNPWDAAELVIASSQLAKRLDRQEQLRTARPWDVIFLDEAHHARRKDFLTMRQRRPNRLLELFDGRDNQPGLKQRTQSLLLMTATPMQVHPVEVWDLLRLLGLGGRWGANDQNFLRFFKELRQSFNEADWDFIFSLVNDFLKTGREFDSKFVQEAIGQIGLVEWEQLKNIVQASYPKQALKQVSQAGKKVAKTLARQHTPIQRYLFRNTRNLLREYVRQGILKATIPKREPYPTWITMRQDEQEMYGRVEEYITGFYQRYERERKGLGFIMTVYRRRLTSSFYALRLSLERRLSFLQSKLTEENVVSSTPLTLFDDDDLEQDDLIDDVSESLDETTATYYRDEIAYLEDFLFALQHLSENDSKIEQLLGDIDTIFKQRNTVLVFTQYTDTMDFLRDQLKGVYGELVACYSGRGGEVWNGLVWVETTKEAIKNKFRQGEEIKILLCTEAASEGLNLQTCGVLINYDMPWNPMRVEQRIGRIDRIGGQAEVWIYHYFYADTVEAQIYQALKDRIGWFEDVVGELQPILARLGQTIKTVAMTPKIEQAKVLETALQELQSDLDESEAAEFDLEQYLDKVNPPPRIQSPVLLTDLERVLTEVLAASQVLELHPKYEQAYQLTLLGKSTAVTFNANQFDQFPDSLQFLTYGNPLLNDLFDFAKEVIQDGDSVIAPSNKHVGKILRCVIEASIASLRAYYYLDEQGAPQRVDTFIELKTQYQKPNSHQWSEEQINQACADLKTYWQGIFEQQRQVLIHHQEAEYSTLKEQGQHLLLQATLIELALGQQQDMFDNGSYPMAFDNAAVIGLRRHKYPFAPLIKLVAPTDLIPTATDPFFIDIQTKSKESLKRQFVSYEVRAKTIVKQLSEMKNLMSSGDVLAEASIDWRLM